MMTSYHNNPEATADVLVNGWFAPKGPRQGRERGYVYLQGRNDEMIKLRRIQHLASTSRDVLVTFPGVGEVVVLVCPTRDGVIR